MVNLPQDTRRSFERFSTTVASEERRVTGDAKVGAKQQCFYAIKPKLNPKNKKLNKEKQVHKSQTNLLFLSTTCRGNPWARQAPSSKLRIHGGGESSVSDDQKHQVFIDDDDGKDIKPPRFSSLTSRPKPEKLIHLIPVLTLLCLLILYINSHSPSQSDLAEFDGFKQSSKYLGDQLIDSGIRSLKNLQEADQNVSKSPPHRKSAVF
ncbi:hypothetical protein V6N13_097702 [Hibiscus sabdariffa]